MSLTPSKFTIDDFQQTGPTGPQGQRGATITLGEGPPPGSGDFIAGDLYIDTLTWELYEWN